MKKYLFLVISLLLGASAVSARTDYILQNLGLDGDQKSIFAPPNCPSYVGRTVGSVHDSVRVKCWALPPVLTPGMSCPFLVKWQFWTDHGPQAYVNYFGDWNPDAELAQSTMYGGFLSGVQEFTDIFTFTAPSTPGWYRMRTILRLLDHATTSFYGQNDTPPCTFFSEIVFHVGPITGKEEKEGTLKSFSLQQNKPNPAVSTTAIEYNIQKRSHVSLAVYNETGQLVKTLCDEEVKEGNHMTIWDGTTIEGKKASSGNYFYTLRVEGKTVTKKAIILQ